MKLGSLFSGSGGFELAGTMCGMEPVWASEIEPYPIAVTTTHFPDMKHLGSVTKIDGAKIEPVDVITFGSPCQDLSVAGRRAGLENGSRSNLFFEAIRIIKEMRKATDDKYPRYIVWENVPGAFSSNKGEDFRIVLQEILSVASGGGIPVPEPPKGRWTKSGEIVGDHYSIAWRILNARYWGVPQSRRRIYLVGDFADRCAGKILFDEEGVRGDTEKVEGQEEGTAADVNRCADGSNPGLVYCMQGNCIDRADTAGCNGRGWKTDESYTLNTIDRHAVAFNYMAGSTHPMPVYTEYAPPLRAAVGGRVALVTKYNDDDYHAVTFNYRNSSSFNMPICDEYAPTIRASGGGFVATVYKQN